jgi:hypothetical protein
MLAYQGDKIVKSMKKLPKKAILYVGWGEGGDKIESNNWLIPL